MPQGDRIEQQIVLTGDKDIQAVFKLLQKTGTDAFDAVAKAAGSITNETAKTEDGLKRVEAQATKVGASLRGAFDGVKQLTQGLGGLAKAAGVVVGGLLAVTKAGAEAADAARDEAASLGLTVSEFTKLQFGLAQSGGGANTARTAISRLSAVIGDALKDGEEGTKIFNELGVSFRGINGEARPVTEILSDIADVFANLPNGARKTSLAIDVFGQRAGPQLIPLLNEGRKGIAAFADDVTKLGGVITEKQGAIGDDFNTSLLRVSTAVNGIRNVLTEILAPAFTDAFNTIADVIASNREAIAGMARFMVSVVVPAFVTLKNAAIPVFTAIYDAINLVVQAFNQLAGTSITAQQVILVGVFVSMASALASVTAAVARLIPGLGGLLGALTGIPSLIGLIVGPFRLLVSVVQLFTSSVGLATIVLNPWVLIIGVLIAALAALAIQLAKVDWTAFLTAVTDTFTQVQAFIAGIFTSIGQTVASIWQGIVASASTVVEGMTTAFAGFRDNVIGYFTEIRDYILEVWQRIKSVLGQLTGGDTAGVGAGQGRAGGGMIRGPGSATSDSIPIWASDGEFMMRAAAVRKYGVSFMSAINSLRFDPGALGYALGGLIMPPPMQPNFAAGGLVTSPRAGNTLNLTIGDQTFEGLTADDDTMDRLTRFASRRQLSSAGRKPRWKQ
jgi:hypothetical protein